MEIAQVFENLTLTGIVGISLIFIAIFMLVSACSLIMSWYAKSKKKSNVLENNLVTNDDTKQELTE